MTQSLPVGFQVTLDPKTRRTDSGRLLVGGSPNTAMRLAPAAAERIVDGKVTVTDLVSAQLADRLLATNIAHPDVRSAIGAGPEQITVVGRGWTVGLAHEAALKLRESAQFWTESYPAMEYRHGPISIATTGRATWAC